MFYWNRPRKNNTHGFQLTKGVLEQPGLYHETLINKTAGKDQLTFRKDWMTMGKTIDNWKGSDSWRDSKGLEGWQPKGRGSRAHPLSRNESKSRNMPPESPERRGG